MLLLPFGRVETTRTGAGSHSCDHGRRAPWRRSAWLAEASRRVPAQLRPDLALLGLVSCGLPSVSVGTSEDRGYRLGQLIAWSRAVVFCRASACDRPAALYSVRALDTRPAVTSCPAACC